MRSSVKAGLAVGLVQIAANSTLVLIPLFVCCTRCSVTLFLCIFGAAVAGRLAIDWASDTPERPVVNGSLAGALAAVGSLIGMILSFGISLVWNEVNVGDLFLYPSPVEDWRVGENWLPWLLEIAVLFAGVVVLLGLAISAGAAVAKHRSQTNCHRIGVDEPSEDAELGGLERAKKREVKQRPRNLGQVALVAGSIFVLGSISMDFYTSLVAATGDVGGPLVPVLVTCANLTISAIMGAVCFPVMISFRQWLRRRNPRWGRWVLSPLTAVVPLIIILVLVLFAWVPFCKVYGTSEPLDTVGLGSAQVSPEFCWCGGAPLVIGGPLCWFLLAIGERLLGGRSSNNAAA